MTLPTTQPINGTEDDSDMFGPPRSSPPIGYHHHRSKVPMISPKLRQREERKRILQLCAHKLERIKDSEANLRRSVCINNTYSRLTDELRREKQSRYLANLPKSEIKPEAAHNNTYSSYKCSSSTNTNTNNNNNCNINNNNNCNNNNSNNNNNTNNLHNQNDPMEMYPSSTIQNYHNLHYQQQHSHQSSISNQSSTTSCITTSIHSTAKPTIPLINSNSNSNNNHNNNNNSNNNTNNNNLSHSNNNSTSVTSSSCQFYSNNNNNNNTINSSTTTTTATSELRKDCALISSYSKTSTISTPTTSFTCHGSTSTTTITRDNSATSSISTTSSSMITPTTNIGGGGGGGISLSTSSIQSTTNQRNNNNNNKFNSSSCHHHHLSTNSVDADLEILDRELSAIDATMPLTDPEITQGAEHLEKAVSSRKRLRNDCDDNDRFVRDTSLYYLQNSNTTTNQQTSSVQHHHHQQQQQQQHHQQHQQNNQKLIDDCPLDLKRPKLSINNITSAQSLSNGLLSNSSVSSLSSSLSPLFGINNFGVNSFNYGIGIGFGFQLSNNFISNSYTLGCCSSQMAMASSLMSAAASVNSTAAQTLLSSNCNLNTNNLITNDLDLELALDLNPPNQKEFEVIMDALRLGTPSPTPSCGSDSCGQAAMMSETGSCNPGGIFNNLVVTSLET